MRHWVGAGLLVWLLVVGPLAHAAPLQEVATGRIFMKTSGQTTRPIGHVGFCETMPQECQRNDAVVAEVPLTGELFEELRRINGDINSAITPMTDLELYAIGELWTYPEAWGDCEDFVLAKRRALLDAGWPPSTLLIAVVRQESGDGHAVLTVRTSRGDLILDNLDDEVHTWLQTPYTYIKRQSQEDAGLWVAIDDDRSPGIFAVLSRLGVGTSSVRSRN